MPRDGASHLAQPGGGGGDDREARSGDRAREIGLDAHRGG
jgi:hypothetical protein